MSRALGDLVAHRVGVSWVPSIAHHPISPEMQYVIFLNQKPKTQRLFAKSMIKIHVLSFARVIITCSDGVWEFISSQEAVDMVARHGPDFAQEAAEELAQKSIFTRIFKQQTFFLKIVR